MNRGSFLILHFSSTQLTKALDRSLFRHASEFRTKNVTGCTLFDIGVIERVCYTSHLEVSYCFRGLMTNIIISDSFLRWKPTNLKCYEKVGDLSRGLIFRDNFRNKRYDLPYDRLEFHNNLRELKLNLLVYLKSRLPGGRNTINMLSMDQYYLIISLRKLCCEPQNSTK